MNDNLEVRNSSRWLALLRITLGVILLATWWENLNKGLYSAQGITDLFIHPDWGAFSHGGGNLLGYRAIVEGTILMYPGTFAIFQLVAELLMGLGLLFGGFTRLVGLAAAFFFLNLFLTYFGAEWFWPYVLLTISAVVVAFTQAGRVFGIDQYLLKNIGKPPIPVLW